MQEFDEATAAYIIPKMEQMPERANWLTHWLIIHQQENRTIGGIGVSGFPDCEGATMMGYFIDRRYEGQGYATEAVSCLLKWLFACPDLQSVVADTLLDGIGSQTVLQRNDFFLEGRTEEGLRWRKSR
ncbi:GNAT family N-acetyltransferase [Tellurirhabdus bombi]|uniref:GNAT family N-acetyltransferase n=1 Tax=Tellurirhabdus bombi TaxID=2907205 RepID=UPI001F2F13BA|nr:GNAT family N-acetyltransferase [Tellurirhabdus bombi]